MPVLHLWCALRASASLRFRVWCAAVVAGIALGQYLLEWLVWPGMGAGVAVWFACRQMPAVRSVALAVLLFSFGAWRSCGADFFLPDTLFVGMKETWETRLISFLPSDVASLVTGMTIGQAGSMAKATKDLFRATGTAHIMVVSGYNVGVTATVVSTILRFLGVPRRQTFLVVAGSMVAFAVFVGSQAPVLRAAVMGVVLIWARASGRKADRANVFLFGMACLLALAPQEQFSLSFLLSFSAVAGLLWLSPIIDAMLTELPIFRSLPNMIRSGLSDSTAATLTTVPITVGSFGRLPLLAPIINAIIAPLVPLTTLLGAVLILIAGLVPDVVLPYLFPFAVPAYLLLALVEWGASWPGQLTGGEFPVWAGVVWYALLVLWVSYRERLAPCQARPDRLHCRQHSSVFSRYGIHS